MALAEGRLTDALAFTQAEIVDDRFINESFFAQARELAPIAVLSSAGERSEAEITFTVGDRLVSADYFAEQVDGKWYVEHPFAQLDLQWAKGMQLSLNGVPIDANETPIIEVLPGGYRFTTSHPMLTIADHIMRLAPQGDMNSFVRDTNWRERVSLEMVSLTPAGATKVIGFIQVAMEACLEERSFVLSCGVDAATIKITETGNHSVANPAPVVPLDDIDPSSTVWSLVEPLRTSPEHLTLNPSVRFGGYLVVEVGWPGELHFSAVTADGRAVEGYCNPWYLVVDISDPDNLTLQLGPHY
ncbi:MAG: hypothetical protein LBE83_10335 [Propionibacteriaceae bacterium]|jgi:hypothetical protein|nr:hypothetical protein [Propionibacteriaceae bacterium]